jgi:hypothetical protein
MHLSAGRASASDIFVVGAFSTPTKPFRGGISVVVFGRPINIAERRLLLVAAA